MINAAVFKEIMLAVEQARKAMRQVERPLKKVGAFAQEQMERARLMVQDYWPVFVELGQLMSRLPGHLRAAAESLAEHGWYVSPVPSFLESASLAMDFDTNEQAAHNAMVELVEAHLDQHQAFLAEEVPERMEPLDAAFDAHRSGQYFLSIPVFLAQADGITKECLSDVNYFCASRCLSSSRAWRKCGGSGAWVLRARARRADDQRVA